MKYLLGIDSSTTATKAVLIDEKGSVIGVSAAEYPFETPQPRWAEQSADLWWKGTIESVNGLLQETGIDASDIAGVGLTGQMHGLVCLDKWGEPIRPALLWNDQRTGEQAHAIRYEFGKKRLVEVTGNDALTGFTAPKILWVRDMEPENYRRIERILLPKDYVRLKLTGEYATDKAGAAGTLLMDLKDRDWSKEILKGLDIPREWLAETFEGPAVTGTISNEGAKATGLKAGTPVVAGGGDQAAQGVGVGAISEGIFAVTLGTSGVVFATSSKPFVEPEGRLHAFCHAVPDRWHMMGVMLSAAGSLRWYRDTFFPDLSFEDLLDGVEDIPPGCDGLMFLPYLTGERTPHPDPFARGGFVGLTVRHTRHHMTRAVLEGVAFGLKDSFTLMQESGLPAPRQVRISGGGAKSPVWRQIIADIFGAELVTVNTTEGAAYGVALLAGVGADIWTDADEAVNQCVTITGRTPVSSQADAYKKFYPIYQSLYSTLKETNLSLAEAETSS